MTQPDATTQAWEMWFTPFPKTVYIARRQVSRVLNGWGVPDDAVDTAVLITSELVTNAIRHCDTRHLVHVQVTDDGTQLLLEVSDPSHRRPRPTVAPSHAESGRGLMLVRVVAADFGARDRDPVGKTVWATIARQPATV
ncbi:ATP-binding protein [Actinacidiphila glaucinigra]|uniref:ATP-binding protein n=1 Tax=Actinacidiphila glaucinigra TaxID=235986 RepID=UPI002E350BCD|nr:ATP-binding protein [Actinacidiphila glaucinigra]